MLSHQLNAQILLSKRVCCLAVQQKDKRHCRGKHVGSMHLYRRKCCHSQAQQFSDLQRPDDTCQTRCLPAEISSMTRISRRAATSVDTSQACTDTLANALRFPRLKLLQCAQAENHNFTISALTAVPIIQALYENKAVMSLTTADLEDELNLLPRVLLFTAFKS